MSNINPPGPPSPKPDEPVSHDLQKAKSKPETEEVAPHQEDDSLTYLGFTFSSKAALLEFKGKFLARMANEMMRQIQSNNDRMLKALKKMREDNN